MHGLADQPCIISYLIMIALPKRVQWATSKDSCESFSLNSLLRTRSCASPRTSRSAPTRASSDALRWVTCLAEHVAICPSEAQNQSTPLSHAMQGDYGPFKASFPVDVPLWMAIYLHQRKQCRIHLPDWLNAEHLQGVTCTGQ